MSVLRTAVVVGRREVVHTPERRFRVTGARGTEWILILPPLNLALMRILRRRKDN